MRLTPTAISVLFLVGSALAGDEPMEFPWSELEEQGTLLGGEVITECEGVPDACLKVVNSDDEPTTVLVLRIQQPAIEHSAYKLVGMVRYEDVKGSAYLEMLNHFPAGPYFSRTLAPQGPMSVLTGSSDWRKFEILFFIGENTKERPKKLELNIVLPGTGTVYLGSVRLVQGDTDMAAVVSAGSAVSSGDWWSQRFSGLWGGILGGVGGLLGGIIGTLGGLGRCRRIVLTLMTILLVFGVVSLIFGIVAVAVGQPYHVFFPLLLIGVVCAAVIGLQIPMVRRRYESIELKRMQAADAG